jgi:hypothetical protein
MKNPISKPALGPSTIQELMERHRDRLATTNQSDLLDTATRFVGWPWG